VVRGYWKVNALSIYGIKFQASHAGFSLAVKFFPVQKTTLFGPDHFHLRNFPDTPEPERHLEPSRRGRAPDDRHAKPLISSRLLGQNLLGQGTSGYFRCRGARGG
jgi:hypothetical protein